MTRWKLIPVDPDRILSFWNRATRSNLRAGMTWYLRANRKAQKIATEAWIHEDTAAGIIAALSPGCPWERNVLEAGLLCLRKPTTHTTYGPNVTKAKRILEGEHPEDVLGGKKVTSFYRLIQNPYDWHSVCVDRHAVRVAVSHPFASDEEASRFLGSGYDRAAEAFREVAKKLGVLPSQVQAVTWEVFRGQPKSERRWAP